MSTLDDTQTTPAPAADVAGAGPTRRRPWLVAGSAAGFMLAGGLLSLLQGQDRNGDLVIAHVTWIWTLLHHQQDLAWSPGGPAQLVPSLWNLPWYWMALHWPPEVAIFYLGALGGLLVWLQALIAHHVLRPAGRWRLALVAVCVAGTWFGPVFRTEFGTTFGNLPTGLLVLTAVLLHLRRPATGPSPQRAAVIGLLLGMAIGFKLTNLVWLVAMVPAMLATGLGPWRSLRTWGGLVLGNIVGVVATGGYWAWLMWDRFGNPLYPFYNGIFHSRYGWTGNVRDDRYTVDLAKGVRMPIEMAAGRMPSELGGRDLRWAVIAELVVLVLLLALVRSRRKLPNSRLMTSDGARFLGVFAAVGWVVWLAQFGIARYMLVLESLSTLLLIALIDLIARKARPKVAVVTLLSVAIAVTAVPPTFLKSNWRDTWFDFHTPPLAQQRHLLVVVPASLAVAHGVLAMPSDVVEVRGAPIYDQRKGRNKPPNYTSLADDEVRREIRTHQGPIVAALPSNKESVSAARKSAERYGMTFTLSQCQPMSSIVGHWIVCPWTKAAQ